MRILKLLQISGMAAIAAMAAAAAVSGLFACSGGRIPESPAFVDATAADATAAEAAAAEKYAVDLANERCEKEFGKRPFKTGRFPALRSGDRWLWGWLDGRQAGYTAQVSFRADRTQPDAGIYPATDEEFDMEAPNAPDLDFRPETDAISRQPESE